LIVGGCLVVHARKTRVVSRCYVDAERSLLEFARFKLEKSNVVSSSNRFLLFLARFLPSSTNSLLSSDRSLFSPARFLRASNRCVLESSMVLLSSDRFFVKTLRCLLEMCRGLLASNRFPLNLDRFQVKMLPRHTSIHPSSHKSIRFLLFSARLLKTSIGFDESPTRHARASVSYSAAMRLSSP
jgi:hypothetical protein